MSQIGFGRSRIGIETGIAIVGDIGIRSKLDYAAHGDSINSTARLEALNKRYGSTICGGPSAAARQLGSDLSASLCCVASMRPLRSLRSGAARLFDDLANEYPEDPVPRLLAVELRDTPSA